MSKPDLKPGLSVIVITKNESQCIRRCLQSVAFADEIVVLDSGSTDDTVEQARALGARVVVDADWPGFGPQKNRVLVMAQYEWVLSIDADEELTPPLIESIQHVVAGNAQANGYRMNRRSCFAGRPLRFGDWASDQVLRLFRKRCASFTPVPVHEQVICDQPVAHLTGLIMHYTIDSVADAYDKGLRYAQAAAPKVAERGRGGLLAALSHGSWTFIRGYLIRGGFLDGRYGLLLAWCNAYGTWMRYRLAGRIRRGFD